MQKLFYELAEYIDVDNPSEDRPLFQNTWIARRKEVSSVFNETLPRQKYLTQWMSTVFELYGRA